MSDTQATRREFVKKVVYVTPVIVTLPAVTSFASAGSGGESQSVPNSIDPQPHDASNPSSIAASRPTRGQRQGIHIAEGEEGEVTHRARRQEPH